MKQRRRIYYTETQKALMWERWRKGDTLHQIARLFDRYHPSIHGILAKTGGIQPAQRHRARLALTLAEREEISRAVGAGQSIRSVAARLGRAPSTISREVRRNGGSQGYRANRADQLAWERARRPKACKLVRNRHSPRWWRASFDCSGRQSRLQVGLSTCMRSTGLSGVARDDLSESLYTGPWCAKKGVAGTPTALSMHASFASSHPKDGRPRQDS
jgi:DNA-binding CsgD family transcriptional regulator